MVKLFFFRREFQGVCQASLDNSQDKPKNQERELETI